MSASVHISNVGVRFSMFLRVVVVTLPIVERGSVFAILEPTKGWFYEPGNFQRLHCEFPNCWARCRNDAAAALEPVGLAIPSGDSAPGFFQEQCTGAMIPCQRALEDRCVVAI